MNLSKITLEQIEILQLSHSFRMARVRDGIDHRPRDVESYLKLVDSLLPQLLICAKMFVADPEYRIDLMRAEIESAINRAVEKTFIAKD